MAKYWDLIMTRFYVSKILGLAVFILGVSVMAGWGLKSEELIQVNPSWVPMQFNTALCFAITGLCLILHRITYFAVHLLSYPLLLIGGITLLEYATKQNILGIDQMFMKHYIDVLTPNPGRMAPNTAICFLLSGVAFGLIDNPWKRKTIAVFIGVLAGIAFTGYLIGNDHLYTWAQLTAMAVHTSIGFLLVALGIISMNSWKRPEMFKNKSINQRVAEASYDV